MDAARSSPSQQRKWVPWVNKVPLLPAHERSALFGETGAIRGVANTIVEKDFWVCGTLRRLFEVPRRTPTLLFKGGTSLSKAYGAIRRFSEDIDLWFDRAELGYIGDRDPSGTGSAEQAGRLVEELVGDVEMHVAEKLLPALRAAMIYRRSTFTIRPRRPRKSTKAWPTPLRGFSSSSAPVATHGIPTEDDPFLCGGRFSRFLRESGFHSYRVVGSADFMGKITALHAETHRPEETPTPQYLSRHYYDIAILLDTEDGKGAALDFELLEQVAKHKAVFFRSSWASHVRGWSGTLQLVPSEMRVRTCAPTTVACRR